MCPKAQKKRIRRSKNVKIEPEATWILRTLNETEAFYFYEDIGKPTGKNATSLYDFLEKIKSVKLESILFHLQRKDFENWAGKTIGDSKLARKIAGVSVSANENVRAKIHALVESRIKQLAPATVTMLVEDLTIASPTYAS